MPRYNPLNTQAGLVPLRSFPCATPKQLPGLFAFPIIKEGTACCRFRSRTTPSSREGAVVHSLRLVASPEEVGSAVGLASLWLRMLLWAELHPCKIQPSPQDLGTGPHVETEEKEGVRPQ